MLRIKLALFTVVLAVSSVIMPVSESQAGPLLDWLRGMHQRKVNAFRPAYNAGCNTCTTAQPVTAYANPYGLQPGQCQRTCMQTCSRTVVNYVPYTAYRTSWERVPVTQYRPVTNSDPCTGCTVTCMKPCTSYTYQMKRVPYTTYRPCYRTETYKVPVTTITNDCATGNCATGLCATGTCATGTCGTMPATPANNGVYYTMPNGTPVPAPSGTISTDGGFSTPSSVPADINPTLSPTTQRSINDRINRSYTQQTTWPVEQPRTQQRTVIEQPQEFKSAPAVINMDDKIAHATVHQRWNYSPVRLASYTKVEKPVREYSGRAESRTPTNTTPAKVNAGWESVDW